jgi:hypothetical protein
MKFMKSDFLKIFSGLSAKPLSLIAFVFRLPPIMVLKLLSLIVLAQSQDHACTTDNSANSFKTLAWTNNHRSIYPLARNGTNGNLGPPVITDDMGKYLLMF